VTVWPGLLLLSAAVLGVASSSPSSMLRTSPGRIPALSADLPSWTVSAGAPRVSGSPSSSAICRVISPGHGPMKECSAVPSSWSWSATFTAVAAGMAKPSATAPDCGGIHGPQLRGVPLWFSSSGRG
jgi:hypothetical protein